ncbi:MAG: hypothetical protein LKE40_03065 [Spirochaetia bacterium]|nr:hypothetical protein [Spirochaetia bacterium]
MFATAYATSLPGQDVLPLSNAIYADMDDLYLVLGIGTPSDSRPWTVNEAKKLLSVVDASSLTGTAKQLYDSIDGALAKPLRVHTSDGFSANATMDLSAEAYAHTNTDGDFSSYDDWTYGFIDRQPLAKLRVEMAVDPMFYTYCDLQYGYGIVTYDDVVSSLGEKSVGALIDNSEGDYDDLDYVDSFSVLNQYGSSFATNLITASRDFDFQWPKRAILSFGGDNWNFNLSRDRINWGNSHIGNFIIDNHVDYHDYARFTVFTRYFKYEALGVFFDNSYLNERKSGSIIKFVGF